MRPKSFSRSRLGLPVIRRRLAVELLELLDGMSEVLGTRGRSLTWNQSFPSRKAYNTAMYRLRKSGFVARQGGVGRPPVLKVTAKGRTLLPAGCRPQRRWNHKWRGTWYVLVYDVPEANRSYRRSLNRFLKQRRLGCLQKSVWVSPFDLRPDYEDLVEAAGISEYAFLFEARTVLGQREDEVVAAAWDMERLDQMQRRYGKLCERNLERIAKGKLSPSALTSLAREEMGAYLGVMSEDPLLPRSLWPASYQGPQVLELHQRIQREIARRL